MPPPRILTTEGAARLGFTDARVKTELRRGRWRRLGRGILLTRPDEPTREDWALGATTIAGSSGTLSGWDVLRRRGLGPADPPSSEIVVLTRGGHNRMLGPVRFRPTDRPLRRTQLAESDLHLPGVWIASTARAIADCSLGCDARRPVRAMATSAVQRGLCTVDELNAELEAGPRRGSHWLRLALADLEAGALSVAEAEAIELLQRAGITDFVANAPILNARGQVVYTVDLLWPELHAVIEIDSREFHLGELEWKRTMARHNALTRMGYAVAHYPPSDIRRRGPGWAHEVARWLDQSARALAVS